LGITDAVLGNPSALVFHCAVNSNFSLCILIKSGEFENSSWLAFFSLKLWYPIDGNAASHSVDSVIFSAVIHLPARFKISILGDLVNFKNSDRSFGVSFRCAKWVL